MKIESETQTKVHIVVLVLIIGAILTASIAVGGIFLDQKSRSGKRLIPVQEFKIQLTVTTPRLQLEAATVSGVEYQKASIAGASKGYFGPEGSPQIPSLIRFVALPSDATNVHVSATAREVNVTESVTIFPTPSKVPVTDKDGVITGYEDRFTLDAEVYDNHVDYPGQYATLDTVGTFRTIRMARVIINPYRINPGEKTLSEAGQVDIVLSYAAKTNSILKNELGIFDRMVRHLVHNPNDIPPAPNATERSGGVFYLDAATLHDPSSVVDQIDYIIIVYDDFADTLEAPGPLYEFANYRANTDGLNVAIARMSDITNNFSGMFSWNKLYSFTQFAYHSWPQAVKPSYLLLVGDMGPDGYTDPWVPSYPYLQWDIDDDDHFAYMDGENDYWQDMAVGRFPVRSAADIADITEKITTYEQSPIETPDLYDRAVLSDWGTDLKRDFQLSGFDPSIVQNCLADESYKEKLFGGFIYYSGHGGLNSWYGYDGAANPPCLTRSQISQLNNSLTKNPIIVAQSCNTAEIGSECIQGDDPDVRGNCLGESFVNNPQLGAVAYYGATHVTTLGYWHHDFMDSIFNRFEYVLGQNIVYTELQASLTDYVLFGDPALHSLGYRQMDDRPDLAVSSDDIAYDPNTDTVSVDVKNLGPVPATNVDAKLRVFEYASGYEGLGDLVADYSFPTLPTIPEATVNGWGTAHAEFAAPDMPEGRFFLQVKIDEQGSVTESFELNNANGRDFITHPETTVIFLDDGQPVANANIKAFNREGVILGSAYTNSLGVAVFTISTGQEVRFEAWGIEEEGGRCFSDESEYVITPAEISLERPPAAQVIFKDSQGQVVDHVMLRAYNESRTGSPFCSGVYTGQDIHLNEHMNVYFWASYQNQIHWSRMYTTPSNAVICQGGCPPRPSKYLKYEQYQEGEGP